MKEKEARKDLPRWLKKLPWTKWQSDAQGNRNPAGQGEAGWLQNPGYFTSACAFKSGIALIQSEDSTPLKGCSCIFSAHAHALCSGEPFNRRQRHDRTVAAITS